MGVQGAPVAACAAGESALRLQCVSRWGRGGQLMLALGDKGQSPGGCLSRQSEEYETHMPSARNPRCRQ